jgi:Ca-activated chloride channel homolog
MANESYGHGSERGRHRRPRRRLVVLMTAAATLGAATVSAAAVLGDDGTSADGTGCTSVRTLRVVAAPEVAPVVETVGRSLAKRGCLAVAVRSADPASMAERLGRGDKQVDVWIPDSSMWTAKVTTSRSASIASSPVVLAVPERLARRLGPGASYEQVAEAATTGHRFTIQAAAPTRSATTQAALFDLRQLLGGTPAGRGQLVALLRSLRTRGSGELDPSAANTATSVAEVVTERAVRALNATAKRPLYRALRTTTPGTSLDYPYVVLSHDPAVKAVAGELLQALKGPAGSASLDALGFRTGDSTPATHPLSADESRAALKTLAVVDLPTRTLAVVDVSGSMASPVPGLPGTTRMDLARTAIRRGVELLPDGTVAGLWRFSSNLTPSTDYEQLAPMTELNRQSRKLFAGALSRLQVDPNGGTGLYSSTLAAVRYVRSTYDPTRVNSVTVLTDGRDQDATAHDISLHTLIAALRAENDPQHKVVVVGIAYGPDSDTAAMRKISDATGGTLYTASDPRELPLMLSEAIGHRFASNGP